MGRRARWITVAAVVVLGAAGLWWRSANRALVVETATVVRTAFEETIAEDGRTRARWHVDVTAPVSGEWRPESLKVGDSVAAGRTLGTLVAAAADPATARQLTAQLGVAEATLVASRNAEAAARLGAEQASRALARAERLGAAGGVSVEQLEQARDLAESRRRELDAAHARVTAAVFSRDAARALLPGGGAPVRIAAPGDGLVLRVDEEHARVVPAGTPLLMIGSLGAPEVVVDVLSTDAGRIPVGATMRIVSGTDTLSARVLRVEPAAHTVRSALGVDEQRVSVAGDVADGAVRLGHDFEVRVRIVVSRREDALVVPAGALVREGTAWSVFVIDEDGRARRQPITLIARGADAAAVDGIAEGRVVVVYPPEALTDGSRVRR
ncbi:MAG: HlyD family efflux transporter periplasmic adaptor subunit [Gemmatimonadota bacterium]|nr:HlyD family efflux transporter periplasmic adaptor subunit [Gemmatimonadota bacterium]